MNSIPALQINLLSKKKVVFDKQSTLAAQAKIIAGVGLIVYVFILVVVMGLNAYVTSRLAATNDAINQAKTSLVGSTLIVNQYSTVVTTTKTIETLMNQRRQTMQLWQQLQQMIPAGCEMTAFSFANDQLQVGVTAPHVVLANQVIDMIEQSLGQLGVQKTTVQVGRSSDASYLINMAIALKPITGNTP